MEHKIVISGEGSAHPKLGVKKKNSAEENLKILNEMIESGKLSLDHAIAKTRPGGTLRGVFNCCPDEVRKQRMRFKRAGFKLWVELHADVPRMIRYLDDFR